MVYNPRAGRTSFATLKPAEGANQMILKVPSGPYEAIAQILGPESNPDFLLTDVSISILGGTPHGTSCSDQAKCDINITYNGNGSGKMVDVEYRYPDSSEYTYITTVLATSFPLTNVSMGMWQSNNQSDPSGYFYVRISNPVNGAYVDDYAGIAKVTYCTMV